MSSSDPAKGSELLYCLTGALLPTIIWALSRKQTTNKGASEDDEDMEGVEEGGPSSKWGYTDAPYKMVLCVNQELGMGKGKLAAQCCHAAVGCYSELNDRLLAYR